ncbi:MAG: Ser-Thr-rich GPI-anchored membrane family protein [bacterium]
MKNSQKGFANIALVVVIIAIVAIGGYFVFSKKSATPTPSQQNSETNTPNEPSQGQGTSYVPGQGASTVAEKDRIQVTSPKGGEKLEVGKTYDVRWTNYSGKEPLTIALQATKPSNQASAKIIASNVPTSSTGSYKWTVTSESPDNKYKIEVYPAGGRPLVGQSNDFFTISGEQLITITSPKPNDRVNLTQPIIITGKARNVFGLGGEFPINAFYTLDNQKIGIASVVATCNSSEKGCAGLKDTFINFTAQLDLSKSPVCFVNVEFYKYNRITNTKPFYVLPLYLFGNENCQ